MSDRNDPKATAPPALERRSFIRNAAAALSATVAGSATAAATTTAEHRSTPAAPPTTDPLAQLSQRLGLLEDADEIRKLQHTFADHLNRRQYEPLVELFASDSEVRLRDGVYTGREGVRRLYVEHFGRRPREAVQGPVHDYLLSHVQHLDTIEVAPDRQSATSRFHCLVRTEAAISSTIPMPILDMARQQGQGVLYWWESGVFEYAYVRIASTWRIRRLTYSGNGPVDTMLERVCAGPRLEAGFVSAYPQNPTGPDRLIADPDGSAVRYAGITHPVLVRLG